MKPRLSAWVRVPVAAAFQQFQIMNLYGQLQLPLQLRQWVSQQGSLIHLKGFGRSQYLGLQTDIARMLPRGLKPKVAPIITSTLIALALAQSILDNLGGRATSQDGLAFVSATLTMAKDPGAAPAETLKRFFSEGNNALLNAGGDTWSDVGSFFYG